MSAPFADFDLPPDKEKSLQKAKRLAWTSIFFMLSIIAILAFTMGASQAMKAMWVEDIVSLVPSVAFLIGIYFRRKPPDEQFPYGYRRAVLIAFLAGSVGLFGFGLYIFTDSISKLLMVEHPTIQTAEIFGHWIWLGWLMIAALVYSVIPPFILGRMKKPLARELHDKTLQASATLDKGDWLSGIAGVAGIIGIGYGWWWADSVAASFISIEIIKDGFTNLRNSVAQLMNHRPTDVDTKENDPLPEKVQQKLEQLDWVAKARVRLREDGDVLTGEAFVVPRDEGNLLEKLKQATDIANSMDWRLHDVNVVPLRSLENGETTISRTTPLSNRGC